MEDTYRDRVCPFCRESVKCTVVPTEMKEDMSFNLKFKATCSGCGIDVEGSNPRVFDLFLNSKPSKMVEQAYYDKDDKWIYITGNYRGLDK